MFRLESVSTDFFQTVAGDFQSPAAPGGLSRWHYVQTPEPESSFRGGAGATQPSGRRSSVVRAARIAGQTPACLRARAGVSPHRMSSQLLGIGAVAFTVLLWGMSGVAIKATSVSGIVAAFYRTWCAIPLLWMTMLSPPLRRRLDREWLRASIIGGALFCVHQILYFTSLELTTVANVTIIGALQPVLVLLLAGRMFGEAVTPAAVVWSIIAFAGTAFVVLGSSNTNRRRRAGTTYCLVATVSGYKAVFTMADKQSKEKVDLLKAMGAEVIVCPTAVTPDDPRSYHSVANKLAADIANAFHPNQYENPANPEIHYRTTGPEIWSNTSGANNHFASDHANYVQCIKIAGTGDPDRPLQPTGTLISGGPYDQCVDCLGNCAACNQPVNPLLSSVLLGMNIKLPKPDPYINHCDPNPNCNRIWDAYVSDLANNYRYVQANGPGVCAGAKYFGFNFAVNGDCSTCGEVGGVITIAGVNYNAAIYVAWAITLIDGIQWLTVDVEMYGNFVQFGGHWKLAFDNNCVNTFPKTTLSMPIIGEDYGETFIFPDDLKVQVVGTQCGDTAFDLTALAKKELKPVRAINRPKPTARISDISVL